MGPVSAEQQRAKVQRMDDIELFQKVSTALMEFLAHGSTSPAGLRRSSSYQSLASPAEEKKSVMVKLQALLQPSLRQDGLWDEAAPILAKLHIGFLRNAVATANVQSVIAKLKAAAYKNPAMRKLASAASSVNLQSLLLTCPEPISPVKTLPSPEALISPSGAQIKFCCCGEAKKAAEEAGKNHLRDLALQLQEESAKKREEAAARAREEEAAKQDKKMQMMESSLEESRTSNRLLSRALSAVQQRLKQTEAERELLRQRLKQTEAEREQLRRERDYFRNLALSVG